MSDATKCPPSITKCVLVKSVKPKVLWAVAAETMAAGNWRIFPSPPVPCLNCGGGGNHQMARIVRHNDESVREGYIRNGGKEVKLFTSSLKAFQCNNRIVMAQRKHLVDFLRGRIIGRLESPTVSSPGCGNDSKMMVM
ncbi:uncharacterized protein TNCV_197941 [Trichonephila clavipes]|nr:uncharacterized protein TNCV_197941 [Trichonephila clavipes]